MGSGEVNDRYLYMRCTYEVRRLVGLELRRYQVYSAVGELQRSDLEKDQDTNSPG